MYRMINPDSFFLVKGGEGPLHNPHKDLVPISRRFPLPLDKAIGAREVALRRILPSIRSLWRERKRERGNACTQIFNDFAKRIPRDIVGRISKRRFSFFFFAFVARRRADRSILENILRILFFFSKGTERKNGEEKILEGEEKRLVSRRRVTRRRFNPSWCQNST